MIGIQGGIFPLFFFTTQKLDTSNHLLYNKASFLLVLGKIWHCVYPVY